MSGSTFRSRRRPLAQKSPKRIREDAELEAARLIVRDRDGYECWAGRQRLVPSVRCVGALELHHLAPRSVAPQLLTDPANLRFLCLSHHDWVDAEPDLAEAVGLHVKSWDAVTVTTPDAATLEVAQRHAPECGGEFVQEPWWNGKVWVGCDCGCDDARRSIAVREGVRIQEVETSDGRRGVLFG